MRLISKQIALLLSFIFVLGLVGCSNQPPKRINIIEGDLKTYYEMSDGTWECEGHAYKYRLEIKGTIPNASVESTFVYLSNFKNISFHRAWLAAGLSSNSEDYFAAEEAILVDFTTE